MLIILDRDGVINEESDAYIKSPAEWCAIPGSLKAIAKLNQAGHRVVVATNQSGIARKYFTMETLTAIHQKMHDELAAVGGHLDGIFFCPHGPDDNCLCRKPKPGLLHQIAKHFQCDFNDAIFIGDSIRDVEAAQAVQCRAILVKTGRGQEVLAKQLLAADFPIFADLAEATEHLLKHRK